MYQIAFVLEDARMHAQHELQHSARGGTAVSDVLSHDTIDVSRVLQACSEMYCAATHTVCSWFALSILRHIPVIVGSLPRGFCGSTCPHLLLVNAPISGTPTAIDTQRIYHRHCTTSWLTRRLIGDRAIDWNTTGGGVLRLKNCTT